MPRGKNKPAPANPGRTSFIVVAYDIADDKRRALLHRRLKKFGLGVQFSVFECLLGANKLAEMKKTVKSTIKPGDGDKVRYYFLCESCRRRIEATDGVINQNAPAVFI